MDKAAYCQLHKFKPNEDGYICAYSQPQYNNALTSSPCEFKCEDGAAFTYNVLSPRQQYVTVIVSNNKDDFTGSPKIIFGLRTRNLFL